MPKKKRKHCRKGSGDIIDMSYSEEGVYRYSTGQYSSSFDYVDMEIAKYIWVDEQLRYQDEVKLNHDFNHGSQPWLPFTPQEIKRIKKHRGKIIPGFTRYTREELEEQIGLS